jgi:PiT family inorganic phosphate transporter
MAGILEIAGALTGTAVALTIGKGLVTLELVSMPIVVAALMGSMTWSLITYYFGIPVSETHGLIGGIIGAALSAGGVQAVYWASLIKVLLAVVLSPVLGFLGGAFLLGVVYRLFHAKNARKMSLLFKNLQRLSAGYMAFSHGRNDAQKPMGMLVMILALHYGWESPGVPLWVVLTVGVVAGLGVAAGGWRIIRTLGMRIAPLRTEQGFAAETSAASVLQLASALGIPVSTTQVITAGVVGAGVARRVSSVRWNVTFDVLLSWILTLPATVLLGWLFTVLFSFLGAR